MNASRPARHALLALIALVTSGVAAASTPHAMQGASLPKVALFTTGGTIQSKGAHRQKLAEYNDGKVTPQELLEDLPELKSIAQIEVTEISNIGSGGMTADLQLKLVKGINAALARPDVSGAVVTHGTGTLEETAYFLQLTVKSAKPVVVVSRRSFPATTCSPRRRASSCSWRWQERTSLKTSNASSMSTEQ